MQIFSSIVKKVQYHETDAMKIVHHSNYIKWMEESRAFFFKNIGFEWAYMERELHVMIPVRFQSVCYMYASRFGDEVEVVCVCDKFDGVKMNFSYVFKRKEDSLILAKGVTKHGFVNDEFNPVNIKDVYVDGYEVLNKFVNGSKIEQS